MHFSRPTLHHPVIVSADHKNTVDHLFSTLGTTPRLFGQTPSPPLGSVQIPLKTVSLLSNFDSYIDIRLKGSPEHSKISLLLDSGNSTLILPYWEDIAALPNFGADYEILGAATEPFGCPAFVVRGPIYVVASGNDTYALSDCIFYACTGNNSGGIRTSNFGAGCVTRWTTWEGPSGTTTLQAPLSYNLAFPFAEFDYAAASAILADRNSPKAATGSFLNLYRTKRAGYDVFNIIPNLEWMALKAKGLRIDGTKTLWPGAVPSPIAMIDTGGGPVNLSDPRGYICNSQWSAPVPNPCWTSGSMNCESISDTVSIEVGNETTSFFY